MSKTYILVVIGLDDKFTYELISDTPNGADICREFATDNFSIYTNIDKLFKRLTWLRERIKTEVRGDYKEYLKKEASALSDALEEWN